MLNWMFQPVAVTGQRVHHIGPGKTGGKQIQVNWVTAILDKKHYNIYILISCFYIEGFMIYIEYLVMQNHDN